jgi:hypothetical protein
MMTIKHSVGRWQDNSSIPMNLADDVKIVQKLLTDVSKRIRDPGLRPRSVNGIINRPSEQSSTVTAILRFQRTLLGMATPDGRVDPNGQTFKGLFAIVQSQGFEILDGVNPTLRTKVLCFIARFGRVTIKSGKRTLSEQAAEMAPMNDHDLDMYGENSSYVIKIKRLPKAQRTPEKVKHILEEAIKRDGVKVSDHLQGNAVDISAQGAFAWSRATRIAQILHLRPKQETSRNCFHVSR